MIAYVGVDAGGTHTEAAVAGPDLEPLARHRGASGRLDHSIDDHVTPIVSAVRTACERASVPLPATTAVIGAAGAGAPDLRERLRHALQLAGVAKRVAVTTDLDIAFHAAFGDGPGMLVSAGTGSVAAARDAAGRSTQVGGYGWRVGDEGSAASLGRAAVAAALRAEDGRGPHTTLTDALRRRMGAPGRLGEAPWIRSVEPGDLAGLVPAVLREAGGGDAIAMQLIAETVDALGAHVAALRIVTGDTAGTVVALNGGLLVEGSEIRTRLVEHLGQSHPDLRVRADVVDPVRGALGLAQRLAATVTNDQT